jgi:hypothetical protein
LGRRLSEAQTPSTTIDLSYGIDKLEKKSFFDAGDTLGTLDGFAPESKKSKKSKTD